MVTQDKGGKNMNWADEARVHATECGQLKMKIALRLDNVTARILRLNNQLHDEEDPNISVCIMNRIGILTEEQLWLKEILSGTGK